MKYLNTKFSVEMAASGEKKNTKFSSMQSNKKRINYLK